LQDFDDDAEQDPALQDLPDEFMWDSLPDDFWWDGDGSPPSPPPGHEPTRSGTAAFYQQMATQPLWSVDQNASCDVTVMEAAYALLQIQHNAHMSNSTFEELLTLFKRMLPSGNNLPGTLHLLRKTLGFDGVEKYEWHACPCGKHAWPPRDKVPSHATDACPQCGASRFKDADRPQRRFYYLGLEETINRFFADPEWVAGRAAQRDAWCADPRNWWGTDAARDIDECTNGALFDARNSAYSLGFDFVNPFKFASYSMGLVTIRSEDHDDFLRAKQRHHKILMIIPGPTEPKCLDAYFQVIVDDFKRLGPAGEGMMARPAVTNADGSLGWGTSFTHRAVLAMIYADHMARVKAQKAMGSAAAYLGCYFCWLPGTYVGPGAMVRVGYTEPVEATRGLLAPHEPSQPAVLLNMTMEGDKDRWVEIQDQRLREAVVAKCPEDKELQSDLGISGRSVFYQLPYVHPFRMWPLSIYHMLCLGLVKDFLQVALNNEKDDPVLSLCAISTKARTAMGKIEDNIVLTGEFGRPLKALRLNKSWLIEHVVRFVETSSLLLFNDEVVGCKVLSDEMRQGWDLLRKAIMHYLNPEVPGMYADERQRAEEEEKWEERCTDAAKALKDYGAWAQNAGLDRHLCTLNLHSAACQLHRQEREMGLPSRYNELATERTMQYAKSKSRHLNSSEAPDATLAKHVESEHCLDTIRHRHPGLRSLQELVAKGTASAAMGTTDTGAAELSHGMLGTGRPLSAEEWTDAFPAIKRLLNLDYNLQLCGWQKEWLLNHQHFEDARTALRPLHFMEAKVKSTERITTTEYGRQRTRASCFVQVTYVVSRYNEDQEIHDVETAYPVVVKKLVMLHPPPEAPPNTPPLRIILFDMFWPLDSTGGYVNGVLRGTIRRESSTQRPFKQQGYAALLQHVDRSLASVYQREKLNPKNLKAGKYYFAPCYITSGRKDVCRAAPPAPPVGHIAPHE